MGFRPASGVPDTFVIAPGAGISFTRGSSPTPNVNISGVKVPITINEILQANVERTPNSSAAQKNFRAAVVLLVRQGFLPSTTTLDKIKRYRYAWESYFKQSTGGTINTGLSDLTTPRDISVFSAFGYRPLLAPGEIAVLFGAGMASSGDMATSVPLPTTILNTQVRVNGVASPLFYVFPGQINFQVPRTTNSTTTLSTAPGQSSSIASSTALVEVFSNGRLIRAGTFQIAPTALAIRTSRENGSGPAIAYDSATGKLEPFPPKQENGQPNIIAAFCTGLGGDATDVGGRDVTASVQATIGGKPAPVIYAGPVPPVRDVLLIGLNQINVVFPPDITPGTHELVISRRCDGCDIYVKSQSGVTITIR